jgi:hypothetical protein
MKVSGLFLAAAFLAATSQVAFGQTGNPGFSAKGEGPWRVTCQVIADGDPKTVILENGTEGFAHRRLSRGNCDYRAGARAEMIVSLHGADACPFPATADQGCQLTVAKGGKGSFKFSIKSGQ